MAQSFVDTIAGQTLNLDISKAVGGSHDMPGLATDLFLIVLRMRESENLGDPAALRKLIMYYLDLFKKNCASARIDAGAVQDALYAIVALVDEAVLSIAGDCRDFWIGRPLQLDLFGDNIAGEEFFNRLQKFLAQPEKKKDVLEVYYLCLSLGFEGKYKFLNPEERVALLDDAGRKLRRAKIRISSNLSPHGTPRDPVPSGSMKRGGGFPIWAGVLIAAGICVATYLGLLLLSSTDLGAFLGIAGQLGSK